MSYAHFMDHVAQVFEIVGVAVLVGGFALGLLRSLISVVRGESQAVYVMLRRYFGTSILLGLEVLVAADLIRTVAVEPTMSNVLVLGLIVLIRTFLSFSLEIEMDGVLPWHRGPREARRAARAAARPDGAAIE